MWAGTLLPVPIFLSISASRSVIVANCARPSGRGGAMGGTTRSWIIHPSYQPLSLLMTNSGEMSVKMSMKARGLLGSVGGPGLGSSTTRTAPIREKVGPKELPRPRWRSNRPLALRSPGRPAHAATSCSVPCGPGQYIASMAIKPDRGGNKADGKEYCRDGIAELQGEGPQQSPSRYAGHAAYGGSLP